MYLLFSFNQNEMILINYKSISKRSMWDDRFTCMIENLNLENPIYLIAN